MNKFTESVLKYLAAFIETRFSFARKIYCVWIDDNLISDLSVSPEFQKKILT